MTSPDNIGSQLQILKEAVGLLRRILDEATRRIPNPTEKDVRRAFINRHGWNIHDLATDVLVLGRARTLGSIYLIARPALESLFKLAAAAHEENFAAEKLVAEVEEEKEKLENWRAAGDSGWTETLDVVIKGLEEFGIELRQRYAVGAQRKWRKTWEVANVGRLKAEYVKDYFIGSKHVHAMISALTDREDGHYISEALHRLTATVCHAAALTNKFFCVSTSIFDDALTLRSRSQAALRTAQETFERDWNEAHQ